MALKFLKQKKKKNNFTFASIVTKNDTLLGSTLFLDCIGKYII